MIFELEGQMGMPRIDQQLQFPENQFALHGGPNDPKKREALYEDFWLLAQEAETLISFGSSHPTSTAGDFVKRLLCAVNQTARTGLAGKEVRHLLSASARHVKALRVNELRMRNAKPDAPHPIDLERLATIAAAFEALRDRYFSKAYGGEHFSAIYPEADLTTVHRMPLPAPSGTNRQTRPGPKPNKELAFSVADIVPRAAGSGPWKGKLDEICEALDDVKIPCPKTWSARDSAIRNWTGAATSEPELAKKAIGHHLKLAKK